jgi:Kef-type K+ transport system membrane component KefB
MFGLTSTPWIDFLTQFASVLLTFLAGAEVDPTVLRQNSRLRVRRAEVD